MRSKSSSVLRVSSNSACRLMSSIPSRTVAKFPYAHALSALSLARNSSSLICFTVCAASCNLSQTYARRENRLSTAADGIADSSARGEEHGIPRAARPAHTLRPRARQM